MSALQSYRTIAAESSDEVVINKSRFIGQASPVGCEEDALRFIRSVRQRYPDASHHCYAYMIGKNCGLMRYSDDGEPGGTAGLPMMDVLKNGPVTDCCVVVTRYFGGVLLGTGGLVRAYTKGCQIALHAAGIVTMESTRSYFCELPYALWDRFCYEAKKLPVQILHDEYTTAVSFDLLVRTRDADEAVESLTRSTNGQLILLPDLEEYRAWPSSDTESTQPDSD